MKSFNLDWSEFFAYSAAWEALPVPVRNAILLFKPNQAQDALNFGSHLETLERLKILETFKDGLRTRVRKDFSESLKALRQMRRNPLFQGAAKDATRDYLRDLLNVEERAALVNLDYYAEEHQLTAAVSDPGFLTTFMECSSPSKWEQERTPEYLGGRSRHPEDPVLATPSAGKDLRIVLQRFTENDGPMSFPDLRAGKGRMSVARLAKSIWAGIRYGLIFADLDDDLLPRIGLHPEVHERLNPGQVPPPKIVEPEELGPVAFSIEDMLQVLVFCSEPRRLRSSDSGLFAKAHKELESTLIPFPDWAAGQDNLEVRIRLTIKHGQACEYLEVLGRGSKNMRIETTAQGQEWLGMPSAQRAEEFLRPMRYLDESDLTDLASYGSLAQLPTCVQVAAAFDSLEGPVLMTDFLSYQIKSANPLFSIDLAARYIRRYELTTQAHLEEAWLIRLTECMRDLLVPLGGLQLGNTGEGHCMEFTPIGRYLLGLTDQFDWPAETESTAIIIQPDFEILFLSPSPAMEATMTRFAERIGTGLGALFRLTRASIQAAARAQQSVEDIRSTLAEASGKPLPKNVALEIESWHGQVIHLAWRPAQILDCPDEETALRILSASKGKLELLGPRTLALFDAKKRTTLTNALRKAGVFLDVPDEPAAKKKVRRRRRSSRWGW